MEKRLIDFLLNFRHLLALASILATVLIASAAKNIYFESDYKIFFKPTDPHLVTHELIEETYTKSDNLAILLKPKQGNVFTPEVLTAIHELTEEGWQAPYAMRVDSLTNYQHTSADQGDLLVEDLLLEPSMLSAERIAKIKKIALSEKALLNRMVSSDGRSAFVNITLQLPGAVDPAADEETQIAQRIAKDESHIKVITFGRELVAQTKQKYPDLELHISGVSAVTNSFNEATEKDMSFLVPLMYVLIVVGLAIFLRSLGSLVGTVLLIGCATAVGFGSVVLYGYALNAVNVMAPLIILTIAVCDAVHLLMVYLRGLSAQMEPLEAMRESLRLNIQPIVLTSITTAVGFLTLNFSSAPPFAEFGNLTATGVMWAMLLTFTFLPSITTLLVRKRKRSSGGGVLLDRYVDFVLANRGKVFVSSIAVAAVLISFIPLNQIDDDPITYFKPGVEFRDASEFSIANRFGVNDLSYSLSCGEPGCVNDVTYLTKLDEIEKYLSSQPYVVFVSTYTDVQKRLNRSMNSDDQAFYRVPDSSDLAAQYNLLYEMSLPYGLDLNNLVNIDKSATRVLVLSEQMTSDEVIEQELKASAWLAENYPELAAPGSSVSVMFAHTGVTNILSMLWGGLFAIIGITITIMLALRSVRYGLISMIPNSIPAFMAFGVWGLTVSQVNLAVAAVFSISLGILVDDTVHFISKYRRGREVKGLGPEESIRYAFSNVASALMVTTAVLVVGFSLLTLSDFNLNAMSGSLTAITIAIALIFDFLILPPVLMYFDKPALD